MEEKMGSPKESEISDASRAVSVVAGLLGEIAWLREALCFYGKQENYDDNGVVGNLVTTGWNAGRMEEMEEFKPDMGAVARAALAATEEAETHDESLSDA